MDLLPPESGGAPLSAQLDGYPSPTSRKKLTRQRWTTDEDVALLKTTLECQQLLNYVEYFKPMKSFWIKISHQLEEQYAFERNHRQCHDRFNVLYTKSHNVEIDEKNQGSVPGILRLLFQIKKTFSMSNGNIVLLNRTPSGPRAFIEEQPPSASYTTNVRSVDEIMVSQQRANDALLQAVYRAVQDLQGQIDDLREQVENQKQQIYDNQRALHELYSRQFPP